MKSISPVYINYIIDRLKELNKVIEIVELGNDPKLIEISNEFSETCNKIVDRLKELDVDYYKFIDDELYRISKKRELKINKLKI